MPCYSWLDFQYSSPTPGLPVNSSYKMTSITTLISVFFTSISFLVPALLFLINFRLRANRFPKSLKWIGLREEMFSKTRACFRQHNNGLQDITEGYAKVCFISDFEFFNSRRLANSSVVKASLSCYQIQASNHRSCYLRNIFAG